MRSDSEHVGFGSLKGRTAPKMEIVVKRKRKNHYSSQVRSKMYSNQSTLVQYWSTYTVDQYWTRVFINIHVQSHANVLGNQLMQPW